MGEKKTHKQSSPPKIPGQSRENIVYGAFFFRFFFSLPKYSQRSSRALRAKVGNEVDNVFGRTDLKTVEKVEKIDISTS